MGLDISDNLIVCSTSQDDGQKGHLHALFADNTFSTIFSDL